MAERRDVDPRSLRALCSGPGKLTQALGITLADNGCDLARGPVVISRRPVRCSDPVVQRDRRIGITKAVELPWRFCAGRQPLPVGAGPDPALEPGAAAGAALGAGRRRRGRRGAGGCCRRSSDTAGGCSQAWSSCVAGVVACWTARRGHLGLCRSGAGGRLRRRAGGAARRRARAVRCEDDVLGAV